VLAGDVSDEAFNESVADAVVAAWGGLDVWICNAGISPTVGGPRATDPAVWRQVMEVNLTGAFLGARAASRVMGEGGRIIFTGSVLGERPRKGLTAYSASKAAVVGLAKGLRSICGPSVTVNGGAVGSTHPSRGWMVRLTGAIQAHRSSAGAIRPTSPGLPVPRLAGIGVRHGTVLNVDGGYLLV
jgi:NAD(P)-dependent dehydrogenase (short-subunit alcohol dehydrogenase family)